MLNAAKLLAVLSLACASSASAAPVSGPKPPEPRPAEPPADRPADPPYKGGDACKPSGRAVFEIDHKVVPGAKLATSTVKLFGNGAWTRVETDADGHALAPTAGCLGKQDARRIATELRGAPWKVTTARIHCMAVSSTFTEYQVDGKLVFTQKLCSGQSLDGKSRAALDAAVARVEPGAPGTSTAPPKTP